MDTPGLLPVVLVTAASADDGTIAPEVLGRLTVEHRGRLELVGADGNYHNHRLDRWLRKARVGYVIQVVSRPPGVKGFVKLPRRWVVERSFAWLGRYRRNSRDYEWHPHSSEAMLRLGSIHRMLRILRPNQLRPPIPFKYRESQAIITG